MLFGIQFRKKRLNPTNFPSAMDLKISINLLLSCKETQAKWLSVCSHYSCNLQPKIFLSPKWSHRSKLSMEHQPLTYSKSRSKIYPKKFRKSLSLKVFENLKYLKLSCRSTYKARKPNFRARSKQIYNLKQRLQNSKVTQLQYLNLLKSRESPFNCHLPK